MSTLRPTIDELHTERVTAQESARALIAATPGPKGDAGAQGTQGPVGPTGVVMPSVGQIVFNATGLSPALDLGSGTFNELVGLVVGAHAWQRTA